jgi:hypothetical protein
LSGGIVADGIERLFRIQDDGVDPSPEVHNKLRIIIAEAFAFAEYVLIAGVFVFVAKQSDSIPAMIVAGFLALLLSVYIMSTIAGFNFFNWRKAETKTKRFIFWSIDTTLFFAVYMITLWALTDIVETLSKGVGI